MKLKPMMRSAEFSYADVSPNSNGERVICDNAVQTLNATVEDKNSTAARIKVNPMSAEHKDVIVGYLHHYKESPLQNVTMYDGRHGCGHDNWLMDISSGKNIRHVITDLKPHTQYALFVKTLTMTDYHMQMDAYSEIQYFYTLPSKPRKVQKIYYHTPSSTELVLHWWPPRVSNGIIEKYIIHYEQVEVSNRTNSFEGIKDDLEAETLDDCVCNLKDPNNSGPPPEDENYYNREQITYDEALPNIIYVSRHQLEAEAAAKRRRKKGKNTTIITTTTIKPYSKVERRAGGTESAKDNTISKDVNDKEEADKQAELKRIEEIVKKFRAEMERKALEQQDTGTDDFPILQSLPVCDTTYPTVQFQLENNCVLKEIYEGIEVPGYLHTFTIRNLQPEVTYRISIRACVQDLINGCGPELVIYAHTVSKIMDEFLRHINITKF